MNKTAIAALLGIGGVLMIMKGASGGGSISDAFSGTFKKPKEEDLDPAIRGMSEEELRELHKKLSALGFANNIRGFRHVVGLEDSEMWDPELIEVINEEFDYLEQNGITKWSEESIGEMGFESIEDFEKSGQGQIFEDDRITGKTYDTEGLMGLVSKYEPYWESDEYVPLPGPQYMAWDESEGELVIGPDHFFTQACVLLDLIDIVKDGKGFKDVEREYLNNYNKRWKDSEYWKRGAAYYLGTNIVTMPVVAPLLILDHITAYIWKSTDDSEAESNIFFEAIMKGFNAALMSSPLMFSEGVQMPIRDWGADTSDKKEAITDYANALAGIVGGAVGSYKVNKNVTDSKIKSIISMKTKQWSNSKIKRNFILIGEKR